MMIDFSQDFQAQNYQAQNEFEQEVLDFLTQWQSPSSQVMVQSSGSTGPAKMMAVAKQKMLVSAKATCAFLGLKKGQTALLCLPVAYISGKMMLVRAWQAQLKIIIQSPSSVPLATLNSRVDFAAMTPLQVENSLEKLGQIGQIIIGGAAVSPALQARLQQLNTEIYETYGMTETLSHIALRRLQPETDAFFRPLPGIILSQGTEQQLRIAAPDLLDEILTTNDVVQLNADQSFAFLGRLDFIINSGGIKINPEILEQKLKQSFSCELVLFPLPDPILGQKMCLAIEGELSADLRQQLDDFLWEEKWQKPKMIFALPQLPRTPNGKIWRLKLAEMF
jgi:o-succinylbenzoate---CoA ligase